jgi:GNAT superfamily N-acetyltransferase
MKFSDCEAADRINMAAFGFEESRLTDLCRNFEVQPDGWFVAVQDETLLGTVAAIDYGKFAHIGKLAVPPSSQRQGIGRSLMEYALAWVQSRNIPAVTLDASEKGYPIYLKMGFSVVDFACIHAINGAPQHVDCPEGVDQIYWEDLHALAAFDAPIFGGDRSKVLRILLRDFSENALVTRDDHGNISGYLFIQGPKLGPWLASSIADAERLLQAGLSRTLPDDLFSIVPSSNNDATTLLEHYGFRTHGKNRHMLLGTEPLRQRAKIYGQSSFAIG